MKATCLFIFLAAFSMQIKAQVPPTVHTHDDGVFTIVWENTIGRLTDLTPEIRINGTWIPASEFESILWVKKRQSTYQQAQPLQG